MQMSCCKERGFKSSYELAAAAITSHTLTKITETVLPLMLKKSQDGETQEEVTCRMQQDVSEWLVDEFMLLM